MVPSPFRFVLMAAALGAAVLPVRADSALLGKIQGGVYTSPAGVYRVPVLVTGELGGTINDNENMVIFQDDYSTYITITALPMDAAQKWDLDMRSAAAKSSEQGLKGYLAFFFENYVLSEFKRLIPQTQQNQTGLFLPDEMGGALIAYALLPGGSMFNAHIPLIDRDHPPVAKRGYLVFVKDGYNYVISSELAEHAMEGSAFTMSQSEEEAILRRRLLEVAKKITFGASSPAIKIGPPSP